MKIKFYEYRRNIHIQFNYKQKIINKENFLLSIFLLKFESVIISRCFNQHIFVQNKLLAYDLF